MSGYHQKLAAKDPNLKDVMECLDVVNDRKDTGEEGNIEEGASDSNSDNRPAELGRGDKRDKGAKEDGKRGPIEQIMDYKQHSGQLHSQHRGLMQ